MVLETHRYVWPNDVMGAEGATPKCSDTVLLTRPVVALMSGFMGLPQGTLGVLIARLAQAWRDLGESPTPTDYIHLPGPMGLARCGQKRSPGTGRKVRH